MKIKDRCSSINKGTEILSSSNNVGNMVALVSDTLRLVRNITPNMNDLCLTHSVSMGLHHFTSSCRMQRLSVANAQQKDAGEEQPTQIALFSLESRVKINETHI